MKKLLALLLTLTMVTGLFSGVTASAEDVFAQGTDHNVNWKIDADGTLTISGDGEMEDSYAYVWEDYESDIKAVVIEDGVTSIGSCAFYSWNHYKIKNVTIGKDVKTIGVDAFSGCCDIESVTVSEDNPYFHSNGNCIIDNDNTLIFGCTASVIPDYVEKIGDSAFYEQLLLTSIVIPDSVTYIGEYAFGFCDALTDITFGKNIKEIREYAFDSCLALTNVYYKGSEEEWNKINIGSYNNKLKNADIHYNHTNTPWEIDENGVLTISGEGEMEYSSRYPWEDYTDKVKSVVIEDGVTYIAENAFYHAFYYIESITIGKDVEMIGLDAFSGCYNIESVTISEDNPYLHSNGNCIIETKTNTLIFGCKNSVIPDYVEIIGNSAFYDQKLITSIVIPDSVTVIDEYAFSGCDALTDVTFGKNVKEIREYAFDYSDALTNVYYKGAEADWNKTNLKVNGNTPLINATFHYTHLTYDNLIWTIDENGVLTISGEGDIKHTYDRYPWEFHKDKIKAVVIEDGVTGIASFAFYHFDIESITIGKDVKFVGGDAFSGCCNIESISVSEDNPYLHTNGNCIIDNENTLVFGCTKSTIPNYVEKIGYSAFCEQELITSIVIPDSVTVIDEYAFSGCNALTDVYYKGAEEEWKKIDIGNYNEPLTDATIHYTTTATVSGNAKNFGNNTTVELLKDGTVIDTKTVAGKTGSYTFEGVEEGTYTVKVSASKHATREYKVTVADEDVTQDVEIWLYGDVTKDGVVNNSDVMQINRKNNNMNSVFSQAADSDYRLKVANITAITGTDAFVNNSDVIQINRKINNMSSMFDRLA